MEFAVIVSIQEQKKQSVKKVQIKPIVIIGGTATKMENEDKLRLLFIEAFKAAREKEYWEYSLEDSVDWVKLNLHRINALYSDIWGEGYYEGMCDGLYK